MILRSLVKVHYFQLVALNIFRSLYIYIYNSHTKDFAERLIIEGFYETLPKIHVFILTAHSRTIDLIIFYAIQAKTAFVE